MACFPYMGSLLYTALYTAKSQGVHLLLPYLPVRQLCLQGGGGQGMDAAAHSSVHSKRSRGTPPPPPACVWLSVAQWIRHQISDLGIAGSSPVNPPLGCSVEDTTATHY